MRKKHALALLFVVGIPLLAYLVVGERQGRETTLSGPQRVEGELEELSLADARGVARDERNDDANREGPRERRTRRPKTRSGTFVVLSESQFLERLHELGIDRPGTLFDGVERQDPGKGAVLVLVSNEKEEPVTGARVHLDPRAPGSPHGQASSGAYSEDVRRVPTDHRGLALFANVEPMEHRLGIDHPDYLTRYFGAITAQAGERTYIEAVLESARERIEGVVTNEQGVPLENAAVLASHYTEGGAPYVASALTGFDGRFSLGVVSGSQNLVVVQKLGYEDGKLEHVLAGQENLQIALRRTETVTIRGFVTHGATSEPLTSFTIDGESFLDPQGRFRIERNVSSRAGELVFGAEGYEPRTVPVELEAGKDVDLGEVALFGARELDGIVLIESTDDGLQPLEGALVTVRDEAGSESSQVTMADGLFAFRALGSETVRLAASAPGASSFEDEVRLSADEPTYVEIRLSPGEHTVRGRVVDDGTDEPVEGARIVVLEQPGLVALTDADGQYEILGIHAQPFSLRASKSGYEPEESPPLGNTEELARWDVRLEASGLRLRFVVGGAPAPGGVPVVLWKRIESSLAAAMAAQNDLARHRLEGATDENGEVTFDVEEGDWFVQVPSYRLHPRRVQATDGASEWITLSLPGVTTLEGRIRNDDGTPVSNTSLWLHSGDQDYSTMFLYHTDASGRYTIPNLAPRPYALSIIKSVADQSAQHVRELQGNGAASQTFDVALPPLTCSIGGRLSDENGTGKSGVWIGVEYLDAPHRSILAGWVGTDAQGRFHVPRLEPGRHIVRTAWTADQTVFSDELTLAPGEHVDIDLVAPRTPGLHVRGHMIASDGGPLGGNFVFATDSEGHQNGNYFSTMDWAYVGAFDVQGLRTDSYRLDLTAMGCEKRAVQVQVSGDVGGLLVRMDREDR